MNEARKYERLGFTVGQLRAALVGLDDGMQVDVRAWNAGNDLVIGGIYSVETEYAHDEDDTPFLVIDCSDDETDFAVEETESLVRGDASDGGADGA